MTTDHVEEASPEDPATSNRQPSGRLARLTVNLGITRKADIVGVEDPPLFLEFSRSLTPFEVLWLTDRTEAFYTALNFEHGAVFSIPSSVLLEGRSAPDIAGLLTQATAGIERGGSDLERETDEDVSRLQDIVDLINGYLH